MKIIASTPSGWLMDASDKEVKSLMESQGLPSPKPEIGTELPAVIFADQISTMRGIAESRDFRNMKDYANALMTTIREFEKACKSLTE